jgi:hypothetical protein
MNAPRAVSLLAEAIAKVRPMLERPNPAAARIRLLWAAAKHARDLAAQDIVVDEFTRLAVETGLAEQLGPHAGEDVAHVLAWAVMGRNPFP